MSEQPSYEQEPNAEQYCDEQQIWDDEWWNNNYGEEEHEETDTQEQPEINKTLVRAIIAGMEHIAQETEKEKGIVPALRTLALEEICFDRSLLARQTGVLIDGGASHNVYYSAIVPEGAEERDVDLAHGSRKGYLLDHDIIFLDKNMSHEQGRVPSIISMGRLVTYGAKMLLGQKGAFLKLPDGRIMKL